MSQTIMGIAGFHARIPLQPHEMTSELTPVEDAIVLCHLGVPDIGREDWSLTIDGLVRTPIRIGFADLQEMPQVSVTSVHQCAGSPLKPEVAARRVCNVTWTGVRLRDLFRLCTPSKQASFVWSHGADHGTFHDATVQSYLKDLPIARVDDDVLIATGMNGEPLRPENGFPARLVVPGFYGTNSVKWLCRIELTNRRATSPFTKRWYNDPILDVAGVPTGQTLPVWNIAPESIIVAPVPEANVAAGKELTIWGWAWADGGVDAVEVSTNQGATWRKAWLAPENGRAWRKYTYAWTPRQSGTTILWCRAWSKNGVTQPLKHRRNAVHSVTVTVQ